MSEEDFCAATERTPTATVAAEGVRQVVGHDGEFDKPAVMELVFDELSDCDSDHRATFEARLCDVTDLLSDRVNTNLQQKRDVEVRRAMRQMIRSFKHRHPVGCTRADGERLLEGLRELGNRVAGAGDFDKMVDEVIAGFGVGEGLRSDSVREYEKFVETAFALCQRLTIDPTRRIL